MNTWLVSQWDLVSMIVLINDSSNQVCIISVLHSVVQEQCIGGSPVWDSVRRVTSLIPRKTATHPNPVQESG